MEEILKIKSLVQILPRVRYFSPALVPPSETKSYWYLTFLKSKIHVSFCTDFIKFVKHEQY